MVQRKDASRQNRPEAHRSSRGRRSSDAPAADRAQVDKLTEVNEQLLTEVEELRRQILEMQEKGWAERAAPSARAVEGLARLTEESPDPALRVLADGRIQYMNPASYALCRQWNPGERLKVPPPIQEIVAAAYARTKTISREMTFGERTYLFTVAPPPPRKLRQHLRPRYHAP